MSSNVVVNSLAEGAVVKLLDDVFDDVAYLDPDTVMDNMRLASGGMRKADRAIRAETATYLMKNFGYVFLGLIVNGEFRDSFVRAVEMELSLDEADEPLKIEARNKMLSNPGVKKQSKGNYVINFSSYNDAVYKKVCRMFKASIDEISDFDDTVDYAAMTLTTDDMVRIGFCASNFMYLIRAFSYNEIFTEYVMSIINDIKVQRTNA